MKARLTLLSGAAAIALLVLLAFNAVYLVGQDRQALVLRAGAPVRVVNGLGQDAPGLKLRVPGLEQVVLFDKRVEVLGSGPRTLSTADGRTLQVGADLIYRIADPLAFYRATGDGTQAVERLQRLLDAALQHRLAALNDTALLHGSNASLSQGLRDEVAQAANAAHLGVEVADVRVTSLGPGGGDRTAVVQRMEAASRRQAAAIRADGDQKKQAITTAADQQAAAIRADGLAQVERIRGDGEAEQAAILAKAYDRDPAFARFFQRMQVYDNALDDGDTTFVLSSSSPLLRGGDSGHPAAHSR